MTPPAGRRIRGLFIAGTDTGVGKTAVAAALLRVAHSQGRSLIPFKPVETGADPAPLDALQLHAAAAAPIPPDLVCLHALALPAAPQAAAAQAGISITLSSILDRARTLAAFGDGLIVEAAGGLLVPYAHDFTAADLIAQLDLPVLLVGRTGLGTINHVALTINELRRRNLRLAGLILVQTTAEHAPHEATNASLIQELTGVSPLAILPYLAHLKPPLSPDRLAQALLQAAAPGSVERLLALATGADLAPLPGAPRAD